MCHGCAPVNWGSTIKRLIWSIGLVPRRLSEKCPKAPRGENNVVAYGEGNRRQAKTWRTDGNSSEPVFQ
jgi:hypothetical protein